LSDDNERKKKSKDVDECEEEGRCGGRAECVNTPGKYECKCLGGYSGDPAVECFDINECGRATACGVNAKCANSPGSFSCSCPEGFSGQGDMFCNSKFFYSQQY
jgi:hypothetical protein